MHRQLERSLSPDDFVHLIFRHKWKVMVWCAVVAGLSITALKVLPRKYQSDAKLFVRLGHETVSLDPTATTGKTVQVQESRENQLNSVRDMLKSRALLERVVEVVGAGNILGVGDDSGSTPSTFGAVTSRMKSALATLKVSPAVSPEEQAIEDLAKNIDVTLARNSSVIDISCKAPSSAMARDTLQAFLDAYNDQHRTANRTAGSLEFFDTQTTHLKKQLDHAIAQLRDVKNSSGIVSIPAEQDALQDQLGDVDATLMSLDTSLAATEASIAVLHKTLVDVPELITTQMISGYPNQATDYMHQEFFKLLVAVHELKAKLGADHPLVKVQKDRIEQLQAILDEKETERVQKTVGANPARQALELDLKREETMAASLKAKRGVLKEQYAKLQERLRTVNDHEIRVSGLNREIEIAEANYRSYADHLEQARIGEALDAKRISSVNIVQPPSFVEKPISPKTTLILGLGLLVAICGSVALPFGFEYLFGGSHRTPRSNDLQNSAPEVVPTRRNLSAHASVNY